MSAPAEDKRRPYRKPRVVKHGTLADVTRTVGSTGRNDMIMSKIRTGI